MDFRQQTVFDDRPSRLKRGGEINPTQQSSVGDAGWKFSKGCRRAKAP
jgi:hypothetical protein